MSKLKKILNLDRQLERMAFDHRAEMLADKTLNSTKAGTDTNLPPDGTPKLIVSLTSYAARIMDVSLTIESIMQGTMLPHRIILWLDHSLKGNLTISLHRLMERGLEVKFCDDIRSYKKLIPTLAECPDDVIITIDDDVLYFPQVVERLYRSYLCAPNAIHALRVHRMTLRRDGTPRPYGEWEGCIGDAEPSPLNFAVGVGGVLYPPHSLDKRLTDRALFTTICPTADDIWFKAMALLKGTPCIKVPASTPHGEDYHNNPGTRATSLMRTNLTGGNDAQLKAVFDHFNLYDSFK